MSRRIKPKVIHARDSNGYLCGFSTDRSWAEKYLSDDFARTLPPCKACVQEIRARGWDIPSHWQTMIESTPRVGLFNYIASYDEEEEEEELPEYIDSYNDDQLSLEEWCA